MRLISGYNPEEHFDEFEDDDIIARWICRTEHLYNYICELKMRKKNTGKWRDIAEQAESSYNKMGDIKDDKPFAGVFNMLCKEGYAGSLKEPDILRENLRNIAGLIEVNPFMKPVEPLIYFQSFVIQRKKMLTKEDYIPNIRNIFKRTEYLSAKHDCDKESDEDTVNEKHKRRAYCCQLYLDMMECFPKVDRELCDEGFLRRSDLSDWYYLFVMDSSVRCIDPESSYDGCANASWDQVEKYERALDRQGKGVLDKHDRKILKAGDFLRSKSNEDKHVQQPTLRNQGHN